MSLSFWRRKPAAPGTLTGRFRHAPSVLATAQGDELVLLDLKSERYFTLNEVGSRTWTLLAAGATKAAIVEAIRHEYDVPSGSAGDPVDADVTQLLARLLELELIVSDHDAARTDT